jgi:hypothetical protein
MYKEGGNTISGDAPHDGVLGVWATSLRLRRRRR